MTQIPLQDFFGWRNHPFADTHVPRRTWLPERDLKLLGTIKRLLHNGKSMALCGPSGSGKTFLVHALLDDLDKSSYRTILIPYAGHPRNGFTRLLAESLGVETRGRGIPLIARIQNHLEQISTGATPRHPVIIIDDAQLLENESLWDLCSLLVRSARQTVAASLILTGDDTLAKRLEMYTLLPVKTRLTTIMKLKPINEYETRLFIETRLKNGGAQPGLFEEDALDIIGACTRGNRRSIMNMATMALEEAYYKEEKTVNAETLYNADWFNESG